MNSIFKQKWKSLIFFRITKTKDKEAEEEVKEGGEEVKGKVIFPTEVAVMDLSREGVGVAVEAEAVEEEEVIIKEAFLMNWIWATDWLKNFSMLNWNV